MISGCVVFVAVADTCGEKLAWFFGITSPKYQYAIDEYNRMKQEVNKTKDNADEMFSGTANGKWYNVLGTRQLQIYREEIIALQNRSVNKCRKITQKFVCKTKISQKHTLLSQPGQGTVFHSHVIAALIRRYSIRNLP